MTAYYNENDPYAAQWLRNLISAGHIAPGDVDERSIVDVRANDLAGYSQCHFFAGIGGWSYALRLAGWADDRFIWTGSCPCQPFSAAGAGKAADDERHLWPAWFSLIKERRPAIVFGEQVEAAIGWGWLDVVLSDLEAEGYACGATVLPACSVGAPHIRQRLWFVAHADGGNASTEGIQRSGEHGQQPQGGRTLQLGDASGAGLSQRERDGRVQQEAMGSREGQAVERGSDISGVEHPCGIGRERREAASGRNEYDGPTPKREQDQHGLGVTGSHWSAAEFIPCTDGKARPVEPGTFPLASGIPGRVGRLRAYGNAITPQCAAEFIAAFAEANP